MRLIRQFAPLGLILLVSYFAWAWLIKPGFYDTHDGLIHLQRIWHFDQAVRQGQYYPRWLPDAMAGLGSPFFNFNWSLPYYVGFILHAFTVGYPQVFKLLMLVSVPISGWGFYLWLQGKIGKLPAFVAGIFYIYAPYRFLDLYVRGALGEAWAFMLFPLIFLSLDHYQKRGFFIIGSLSWAGLILTHNGLALIMLPVFLSYVLLIPDQRLSLRQLFLKTRILLLGLGLTAFFWLPAFLENQYILFSSLAQETLSFVPFRALVYSRWEGGSVFNGQRLIMSFQIGLAQLLVVGSVLGFLLLDFFIKPFRFKHHKLTWFFLVWFLISVFLLVDLSRPVWAHTPILKNAHFSFRMLFLVVITTAGLAGILVKNIRWQWLAAAGLIVLVIYANRNHWRAVPQAVDMGELAGRPTSLGPGAMYLPKWLGSDRYLELLKHRREEVEIIEGEGKVSGVMRQPLKTEIALSLTNPVKIRINRSYFPGWKGRIDGKPADLSFDEPTDAGVIYMEVPAGEHQVVLEFTDTWPRKAGKAISLVSLLGLAGLVGQTFFLRWRHRQ